MEWQPIETLPEGLDCDVLLWRKDTKRMEVRRANAVRRYLGNPELAHSHWQIVDPPEPK